MCKTNVAFWKVGFYPAKQNNLKSIQKALIGWKKAGPPKKPLLFQSCVNTKQTIKTFQNGKKKKIGWKKLNRKPAPIEMIM